MTSPACIVQVVDTLSVGGAERVAVSLANALAARGYDSHLLVSRAMGPLSEAVSPQVHVACAERTWRFDRRGMRMMADYIEASCADVVHSHSHHPSYLVRFVRRLCRTRFLHVVHDHHGLALGDWKVGVYDWLMLRHVDAYLAVTQALRERAARLLALPPERCLFVSNGVELPPRTPPWQGPPTVVHVANLRLLKNHATALHAAARLRERLPGLRWLCVGAIPDGPSPYMDQVRSLLSLLRLAGCVELLGARNDVRAILAEAHVGVLTSDVEGLPMAVLEYMAAQLPVVMTDVGEGPIILREARAGFVVPPRAPDRFADVLWDIFRNMPEARRMGERGRVHVENHFSVDAMVGRIGSLYEKLLAGRRSA